MFCPRYTFGRGVFCQPSKKHVVVFVHLLQNGRGVFCPWGVLSYTRTKQDKNLLEDIQIEAMRIVTGATKLCSIDKLYIDTGWEKLKARREKQKIIIFYKMINRLCPEFLNQLVPDSVQTRTQYSLRNSNNMSTIRTNTELYYNSFLPSTVRAWNNLSNEIRTSTSLNEFKRKLSENVNKPPKYY